MPTSAQSSRTRDRGFNTSAWQRYDDMVNLSMAESDVSVLRRILPRRFFLEMYDKFMAGNLQGVLEAQYKLAPLRMVSNLAAFRL